MMRSQTARALQAIGLFTGGAAVGHHIDRIFAGGNVAPNLTWIGVGLVVGFALLWAWLRPTPPTP
jgi:hypothetical protein